MYAFIRQSRYSRHDAEDLTQEFFCQLIQHQWLQSVDPAKGKLRTFLMTATRKFLSKQARFRGAQRRGGDAKIVSFDADTAEERLTSDQIKGHLSPQECYDRQWALALLEFSISRLQHDYESVGKEAEFAILKPYLMSGKGEMDYSGIATKLATSEGAARVAVHRMRKRFRESYRAAVSDTVADAGDVDEEIRYLAAVLGRDAG